MIYLDNAATTMHKPKEVIDAVVEAMTSLGNAGRGANEASLSAARIIYDETGIIPALKSAQADPYYNAPHDYYASSLQGLKAAEIIADNMRNIYPNPQKVRTVPNTTFAELRSTIDRLDKIIK